MATKSGPEAIFTLFSNLPGELRSQIWRTVLPAKVEPALFLFKPDLWSPLHLKQGEEGYDPDDDDMNWYFQWNYQLLDEPHVDIPLAFVNREARNIALDWIRKNDVKIRFQESSRRSIFTRGWAIFDDILYIPADQTNQFAWDPINRFHQPDMQDRSYSGRIAPWHVAVPEAVLSMDDFIPGTIDGLMQWYNSLCVLNIVLDPQPDFHPSEDPNVSPRWELKDAERGAFVFDSETKEFSLKDGQSEYDSECALSKGIERLFEPLKKEMRDWYKTSFEIRTVYAVRG